LVFRDCITFMWFLNLQSLSYNLNFANQFMIMSKQEKGNEIDPIAEKMKDLIRKLDQENAALKKIINNSETKINTSSKPKTT